MLMLGEGGMSALNDLLTPDAEPGGVKSWLRAMDGGMNYAETQQAPCSVGRDTGLLGAFSDLLAFISPDPLAILSWLADGNYWFN